MNKFITICALITICVINAQIGASMSHEAVGLALGVIVGMMAGIPAALIGLAASPRVTNNYSVTVQPEVNHVKQTQLELFRVVEERAQLQEIIARRLEVTQ